MASDTSEDAGASTPTGQPTARQQAWQAVQLGAQPLWQTAHQWTVAALLVGCIVIGCYTLLLTWPLTQSNAKVDFEGNCETRETQFAWYDRQIYGLVLKPCQTADPEPDGTQRTDPASAQDPDATPVQSGLADAPDPNQATDTGDTPQAPLDSLDGNDRTEDPADPADQGSPVAAQPGAAGPSKPVEPPAQNLIDAVEEAKVEIEGQAFAASRQPNALFVAVLAAGLTGGAVYSLRSHTIHVARHSHDPSWGLWNLTRPFLGAALAVFLFFLIRAGFVQNSGGGSEALRPEGFIALGGLVGLFSDQAWARMRIIAESVFSQRDQETSTRTDPGPAPGPAPEPSPAPTPPETPSPEGGEPTRRPETS